MGRKRKSGEGTVRLRKDGYIVIGYDDKGLPKTKNVLAKTKGGRGETEYSEKLSISNNCCQGPTGYALRRSDDILV